MFDHFGYGGFAIRLTWMGKKEFAILLAADFKSAEPKEVRSFFDDGFQIRRSASRIVFYIPSSTSFQSINPLPFSSSSTARAMTLRLSALKGSV